MTRIFPQAPDRLGFSTVRRYGWCGLVRLVVDIARTWLSFPGARLVRFPIYIRGRNRMAIGAHFTAGIHNRLDAFDFAGPDGMLLSIGDRVQINDRNHIAAVKGVTIGNDALLASNVFITDHDHGAFSDALPEDGPDTPPSQRPLYVAEVTIGDRVWIGEGAQVLAGSSIGAGSVIGAGSIVTGVIPPDSLAVGIPARVIRRYDRALKRWVRV